jgi:glycosyltransferase involved in cell wall biosynthesis
MGFISARQEIAGKSMGDSEPIDVIMCTWNSNEPYFRNVLLSIKKEVDVHDFIVIDRYSTDGTLEIVRSVFPRARVFQTFANLGIARKMGIERVTTEYFAFIDDDIKVSEGWFTKLISFIKREERVAAVQGSVRYDVSYMDKARAFELSRRKENVTEITGRGYTHNTLLRTSVLMDFNPPGLIHSWEDFLITQHANKKGYRWFELKQAQVIHYRIAEGSYLGELRQNVRRARWNGAGDRIVHKSSSSYSRTILSFLIASFRSMFYYMAISILVMDPWVVALQVAGRLGYLAGLLSAEENVVPHKLHAARRYVP